MSGNGRGNMRPTSRSPQFLVIGLLVALCILAFNYWNLSSKNSELSNQNGDLLAKFDTLQLDFRTVSDKHLSVQKRASDLSTQVTDLQEKLKQADSSSLEKDTKLQTLTDEKENLNKQLTDAQGQLTASKKELERVQGEMKSKEAELNTAKEELQKKQNAPVTCDKQACKDPIREVVGLLTGSVSKATVSAALKPNAEVMTLVEDLLQGPDSDTVVKPQSGNLPLAGVQPVQQGGDTKQKPKPEQVVRREHGVVHMEQLGVGSPKQGGGGLVKSRLTWQTLGAESHENFQPGGYVPNNKPMYHPLELQNVLQGAKQQPQELNNFGDESRTSNISDHSHHDPSKPEIVAQNIPAPGGEDPAVNNDLNVSNDNSPAAQEDNEGRNQLELPEDEIDRQAAANQGEALGDLRGGRNSQLADLAKNPDKKKAVEEEEALYGEVEEGDKANKAQDKDIPEKSNAGDKFEQPREVGVIEFEDEEPKKLETQ